MFIYRFYFLWLLHGKFKRPSIKRITPTQKFVMVYRCRIPQIFWISSSSQYQSPSEDPLSQIEKRCYITLHSSSDKTKSRLLLIFSERQREGAKSMKIFKPLCTMY